MGPCAEIISFEAADGVRLSGALFEPKRQARAAVILLHGNGDASIFRSPRTTALAERLIAEGYAFFPFDNRGSGLMRWLKRKRGRETEYLNGGTAFERIADSIHDIDGAARFLRRRGHSRIVLAGHSTGANKIVLYDAEKGRNRFTGYALLAPGDDTGYYRHGLGKRKFRRVLQRAKKEVARGNEESLIPAGYSPFPISWGAFLETIDPDADYNQFPFGEVLYDTSLSSRPLFRSYSGITKRMVVIWGSEDEFGYGDIPSLVDILRDHEHERARADYTVIPGADHGFGDHYDELGAALVSWLDRVTG